MAMDIKTEPKVVTTHKVGLYFSLDELEQITEALYDNNQKKLLSEINEIVHRARRRIEKLNNAISDAEILAQQDADQCKSGVCD